MKATIEMKNVTDGASESLSVQTPFKLLGGLAVGALLMTAMALPLSSIYADGPSRPLTVERITNPAWIYGDDRYPQFFTNSPEVTLVEEPSAKVEVNRELDAEAMDDLIRYLFPSDVN